MSNVKSEASAGDAELIARLREGVAAKGDGTYHIVEAEKVMDFAADALAAANAELATLRGINANLMGDDENVPRYTMKRMKQEVERRLAAANAMRETVALRRIEQAITDLEALIERVKGEHGKPGYGWNGRLRGLQFARAVLLGENQ